MLTPIYLDNDALIRISLAGADNAPVTTATVTATVLRMDGSQVDEPISMPHAEGGVYEGAIPDTLGATEGELLEIRISATAGPTVTTLWIAGRAMKRRVTAAPI